MEMSVDDRNMDFMGNLGLTLGYLVLLMVCGLVGNTLVFLVYYKKYKPSITRTYILAMSVCDLLSNCLALPSDIYEIRFHYDFSDDPGCKFFGFITRLLALSGAFILIAIALDRRRKICQPTKKQRTMKQVYIELTCLGIFSILYAVPFGVLRGLQTIPIPDTGINGTTCSIEDQYVGSRFFSIFNASVGLTFIICVSIMSVCYILIARHLWLHKKRLQQNAKKRHQPGPGQDSKQSGEKARKSADNKPATQPFQKQAGDSARGFTSEQSEDDEENKAGGKLQIGMAEDSDMSGVISDLDDTTTSYNAQSSTIVSTSLTNISETDTSGDVQEQALGDSSLEHIIPASSLADPEKAKLGPKTLREATMVANASKSHKDTTTTTAASSSSSHTPKRRSKKKKKKRGLDKNGVKKLPSRTTLMMFVLTALYVVSYLPYLSMAALFRGRDIVGDTFWQWNLHQIALRSFFLNSAVNPLVYSFCSVKFRQECYLLLRRK